MKVRLSNQEGKPSKHYFFLDQKLFFAFKKISSKILDKKIWVKFTP